MSPSSTRLPLRDDRTRYGLLSRVFHWAVAALILWQLLGMGLRLAFGRQPFVSFFVSLHQPIGALLFVLIVLRTSWWFLNRRNRPDHGAGLLGRAAGAGHGLIYVLMLAVPSLGLLRAYGSGRGFAPFGLPVFPARDEPVAWMVEAANLLHGELAWVLAVVILGHVIMVGLHEAMWRDGTLDRMLRRRV